MEDQLRHFKIATFVLLCITASGYLLSIFLPAPRSVPEGIDVNARVSSVEVLVEADAYSLTQIAVQATSDSASWNTAVADAPAFATDTAVARQQAAATAVLRATQESETAAEAWATTQAGLPHVTSAEATAAVEAVHRAEAEAREAEGANDQAGFFANEAYKNMEYAANNPDDPGSPDLFAAQATATAAAGTSVAAQGTATAASVAYETARAHPALYVAEEEARATAWAEQTATAWAVEIEELNRPLVFQTPTLPPTPEPPTPAPRWLVRLEGPQQLAINKSDAVTLTLIRPSDPNFVAASADRQASISTIIPSPTRSAVLHSTTVPGAAEQLPAGLVSNYDLWIEPCFAADALQATPRSREKQSLYQSLVEWSWTIRPLADAGPGERSVGGTLYTFPSSGGPSGAITSENEPSNVIWQGSIPILVEDPLIARDLVLDWRALVGNITTCVYLPLSVLSGIVTYLITQRIERRKKS
jgi:hypothetical protein